MERYKALTCHHQPDQQQRPQRRLPSNAPQGRNIYNDNSKHNVANTSNRIGACACMANIGNL